MAAMAVGGLANFFSMAPRIKILVSIIWFSDTRKRMKTLPDTSDP